MSNIAPQLQLLIAGVDVSQYALQDQWTITQQWGRQGSTARFRLFAQFDALAANPVMPVIPQVMQPVVFNQIVNSVTTPLFSGLVTMPRYTYFGPTGVDWEIECRDFTYFADLTVVNGDFSYQRADQIIKQLVAQANIGLTTNHVQLGAIVPRYRVNYKPLSTVLTQLAAFSSGSIAPSGTPNIYGWYVDTNRDIHWYNQSQTAGDPTILSGVTFSDNVTGTSTTSSGYMKWESVKYEYDGQNIRNSCVVRGGNIQQTQTDTFVGNGVTTTWPLTFSVLTTNPHFQATVNGVKYTVDTPSQAAAKSSIPTFLAQQNNSGQWFMTVNPAGNFGAPPSGQQIIFKYNYEAPVIARADLTSSQAAFRQQFAAAGVSGASGVFQAYIPDRNIKDAGTAQARAQRELQEYGKAQERIQFTTVDDFPGSINAGQIFTVNTRYIPNSQNGYALGFTANFLAQKVDINASAGRGNYRLYDVMGVRIS